MSGAITLQSVPDPKALQRASKWRYKLSYPAWVRTATIAVQAFYWALSYLGAFWVASSANAYWGFEVDRPVLFLASVACLYLFKEGWSKLLRKAAHRHLGHESNIQGEYTFGPDGFSLSYPGHTFQFSWNQTKAVGMNGSDLLLLTYSNLFAVSQQCWDDDTSRKADMDQIIAWWQAAKDIRP